MDTKFIFTIVLLSLINLFSHQEDDKELLNDDLTVQLSSRTDTCYYSEDKIVVSIEFRNNGLSSFRINKNMLVTTKDIHKGDAIKVNICHDNEYYVYAPPDGRAAMQKKCKLSKDETLIINDKIKFRQLALKADVEAITNISKAKVDNKDFGDYQLQAIYIMSTNDTIFSNWITVNYLE